MPSGDVSHYQWATVINVGSISFNLRFGALLSAWLIFKGTLAGFLSQPPHPETWCSSQRMHTHSRVQKVLFKPQSPLFPLALNLLCTQ